MRIFLGIILGSIIGGSAAAFLFVSWFGWGVSHSSQDHFVDPTRADYVDLLLTLASMFLAAIGVAVTVGALVVGLVALKTLREIKDDAARDARDAAASKISETMDVELEPNVQAKVHEALPSAIQTALLDEGLGHKILREMAQNGELDRVLERAAASLQGGYRELSREEATGLDADENEQ